MTVRRTAESCRIALVHDWLTGMRGGERVLETLCRRYPHADLFTMIHVPGTVSGDIERLRPRPAFTSRLPFARRVYRYFLPLYPLAVELFDLDGYDLVISTSHCAVKSVVVPRRARHLCYCHSPMRYAWDQFEAYFGRERLGWATAVARPALRALARWDAGTSGRVDRYLANSQHVAARIRRYYNRRASVLYPPVDTDYFRPSGAPAEPFALVVSALVPYKRVDVAVEACRLVGLPLRIVGQGPERKRLEALAGGGVEFVGAATDEEVRGLYQRARVVLLTGEEDFGLVPVEAQACGRPVVAFGRGGATETVEPNVTGLLVDEQTPSAFADSLRRLDTLRLDPGVVRARAERFSRQTFVEAFDAEVDALLNAPEEAVRW